MEKYYRELAQLVEFKDGKPHWLVNRNRMNAGDIAGYVNGIIIFSEVSIYQ